MSRNVLLVQPDYYSQYPPLGLLKLSSYHKKLNDETEFVKGLQNVEKEPNIIYVTSLFTWAWRPVWKAIAYYKRAFPEAEIWLGGLYATLLPEHAELSGIERSHIFKGVFKKAEDLLPDYSLVPKWNGKHWDGSIIFSSRGCIRKCPFCAVPVLEGGVNRVKNSIKSFIWPKHTRVILWDNNILGAPNWRSIMDELQEIGKKVDFNQGLDARLITDEVAEKLSNLKMEIIRIAYDQRNMRKAVQKAIERLSAHGINKRKIICYTMYNFGDDPQDLFERVRDLLNWGAVAYPMRYQPILELPYALEKNTYVAPKWDKDRLEIVARLRRVVGFGGAFPPYKALVDRFNKVKGFDEMLHPEKKQLKPAEGQMTLEMKTVKTKRIQRQKPRWGGELDWRKLNAS